MHAPRMTAGAPQWARMAPDQLQPAPGRPRPTPDGPERQWLAQGDCRCPLVDSGGFQRFTVLVATVKFVALNLKEVDNCGKFL